MLYIKLINIFFGSEVSKIISVPFFFSTLYISFNPLLRFSKFTGISCFAIFFFRPRITLTDASLMT